MSTSIYSLRVLTAMGLILLPAAPAHSERPVIIKAAVDGTFPPQAMPDGKGGVEGFNIDLLQKLDERLTGIEIELVLTQAGGFIPGLAGGRWDMIGSPLTMSQERAENLLFTEAYLPADFRFVVRKGAPDATKLEDFAGKVVATSKGTLHDQWATQMAGEIGWTVQSYGTHTDAIQAVLVGRADAHVTSDGTNAWAVKQNSDLKLSYHFATGNVFAAAFRKEDTALRNTIESGLECLKIDGTMAELYMKWFGIPASEDSASLTVYPGYGMPGYAGHVPLSHEPTCP